MDLRRMARQPRGSVARVSAHVPQPIATRHPVAYRGILGAKLHIGCGVKRLHGWINADGVRGVGDVVMDLQSEFPLNTYAEIYGSHVLEHVWPEDTPRILHNLFNALLPGGTLRLSVPDIRLVVKNCIDGHAYGDERSALAVIHGGSFSQHTAAPDLHRQTFWKERLHRLLAEAGFTNIREWQRGQYPPIDALQDYATFPFDHATGKSLISLNMEADRPGQLPPKALNRPGMDLSVILGTVDRGQMLRDCVKAVRESVKGLTYEIVIAYGRENEPNLQWMRQQPDIVPVFGGMDGAIEAFNRAYEASRGQYICQINDDVMVEGDAISLAVKHLNADDTSAGVVFKFDRDDGKGYHHEMFVNALHPNQMVVRRETCETVIEEIGAFWGDAKHRTDKTYGGDTLFGVICNYRGLRLDSVDGVQCSDLLAPDQLRADNKAAVSSNHGRNFSALITPYMTPKKVEERPALYLPKPGMFARRSPIEAGAPLRLLHLSLRTIEEPQLEMRTAFAKIGPSAELPWLGNIEAVCNVAASLQPQVVFAQIQGDNWQTQDTRRLREAVGPSCTLVLWTGDVRTSGVERVERWLARAGKEFDIVLASNTTYARKLKADEGATAACGFMQCGVWPPDPTVLAMPEDPNACPVFFGTNYPSLDGGERLRLFNELQKAQVRFALYGRGWERTTLAPYSKGFMVKSETRAVIRRAPVTIVTSLFKNLGRYSSDRLARTAVSGGVIAVQRFVDMEGLGLRDGENCITWAEPADLIPLLKLWTAPASVEARTKLRQNAVALAKKNFTWDHSVQEFLAIVRDYRARKGLT